MLDHPEGQDLWVFGYGSLMWNPGFRHVEAHPARLFGYHRAFCIQSNSYRGTEARPGLVFGLDRGGSCRGRAYRVPAAAAGATLGYLEEREMGRGAYVPGRRRVHMCGRTEAAVCLLVNRQSRQYVGRLPFDRLVELVLQGNGERGSCFDYLANTVRQLDALGLKDGTLTRLLDAARRRRGRT